MEFFDSLAARPSSVFVALHVSLDHPHTAAARAEENYSQPHELLANAKHRTAKKLARGGKHHEEFSAQLLPANHLPIRVKLWVDKAESKQFVDLDKGDGMSELRLSKWR